MRDHMTRLQQEAEKRYNRRRMTVGSVTDQLKSAFIAGRTISTQQLEQAAEAIGLRIDGATWATPEGNRSEFLKDARAAFEAAGLVVEE